MNLEGWGVHSNVVLGSFSAPSREAPDIPGPSFWSCIGGKRCSRSGDGDMLENDDPLNEFALFLRSKGIQYGVGMGAGHFKYR